MDFNGLVRAVTNTLKEANVGKVVKTSKHVLHIKDEEGTNADFIFNMKERESPFNSDDVKEILMTLIQVIEACMQRGEAVAIRGFGRFEIKYYNPRVSRNIQTGEPVHIPGRCIPKFVCGRDLKTMAQLYENSLTESSIETRIDNNCLDDEWYNTNLFEDSNNNEEDDLQLVDLFAEAAKETSEE